MIPAAPELSESFVVPEHQSLLRELAKLKDLLFLDVPYPVRVDERSVILSALNDRRSPTVLIGPRFMQNWRPCGWFKYSTWSYIHGPIPEESGACDKRGHFRLSEMMTTVSQKMHPDTTVVFLFAGGPFAKTIVRELFLNPEISLGNKDVIIDVGATLDAMAGKGGTRKWNGNVAENCEQFAEGMPCDYCREHCGGMGLGGRCASCSCDVGDVRGIPFQTGARQFLGLRPMGGLDTGP